MTSLKTTEEYFSNLRVLLSNCDREVIDDVDKELLQELKSERSELDQHHTRLKNAVDRVEWSSDSEREEYISEMDEAFETLNTGLSQIDVDEGVDSSVAKDMRNAARILSEDTAGIMEDI